MFETALRYVDKIPYRLHFRPLLFIGLRTFTILLGNPAQLTYGKIPRDKKHGYAR